VKLPRALVSVVLAACTAKKPAPADAKLADAVTEGPEAGGCETYCIESPIDGGVACMTGCADAGAGGIAVCPAGCEPIG
jgi:hypothetical protein